MANMSVEFIDHILTSLRIISLIKERQKISVRHNILTPESSNGCRVAFRRWFHGDSRHITLTYIKSIISNAIDVTMMHTNTDTIKNITSALVKSKDGLTNMMTTYYDDINIIVSLDILKDRIDAI